MWKLCQTQKCYNRANLPYEAREEVQLLHPSKGPHYQLPGTRPCQPPLRLWVHANKVHIRPVEDLFPANNNVQPGEEEIIPPHSRSRSRSRSPEASCSRVSMGSPNSYVVADSPPRPPTSGRGSCRPPAAFNLRSAWDSSSYEEEEEEGQIPVHT